jgi:CPA1 family monovalent cation:H+ antiporter
MIPGMPLAAAFVLGAIVSPPDAIAATAITERLQVPKRVVTVLEGESLVNDATALVAYSLAILTVKTGSFSLLQASWKFVLLSIGGVAIGLLVGWIVAKLHKLVHEPHVEGILSLLTPYLAYLPAEWCHVSGVLAAVAAGIYMARQAPRVFSANSRVTLTSVWETLVFLLNGFVFIIIGLQLPAIAESLSQIRWGVLFRYAIVISLVAILVRLLWVFSTAYLRRVVRGQGKCVPWDEVTVVSWAGMRGIVSLAAALALPMFLDDAKKIHFPQRELIIYLAFSVILATLVFQGLTLAPLIRLLKLAEDKTTKKEEWEARLDAAHAAVARLQVLALEEGLSDDCLGRVRDEYDERITRLAALRRGGDIDDQLEDMKDLKRIRREALIAERRMITLLRDQNIIGDEVLRRVIRDIDLAEARLS